MMDIGQHKGYGISSCELKEALVKSEVPRHTLCHDITCDTFAMWKYFWQ